MSDSYTDDCVICEQRPCEPKQDFCADCMENGEHHDNFGRCYFCRDFHDHEHCIGVPCQCQCPPPDQRQREQEREAVLAKLTPAERQILGH
jgi:hypothetical protein